MAIYHLETKVVSRGTGRSAVAAAAYLQISAIAPGQQQAQYQAVLEFVP